MDVLSPHSAQRIVAACQAAAEKIGKVFSQAFSATIEVSVGEPGSWNAETIPADLAEPGLTISFKVGGQALLLLIPESCGLLPSWYGESDAGPESRLSALAQELSGLLMPDETKCEFSAARVRNIADTLVRSGVATGAATLELSLIADEKQSSATLVWPASHPELVFSEPRSTDAATDAARPASAKAPVVQDGLALLPPYSRNLLRVRVPVMVTLASKKQPISKIVEIVPGAIIQFNKSCEEMLEMEVGAYRVALGECVKVGDKFGLRITSLILPPERFEKVEPAQAAG